jgi:peroxiredoxin
VQLRQREDELAARDAAVLVVSFDAARRVRGFCRRHGLPFTCLVDEAREAYRAYGFGRASWLRMLTPRTLAPYIRHAFMTRGLPSGGTNQDKQQMGGDVVVDPAGRIALAHASDDPADRPTADAILAAIDRGSAGP